MDATNKDDLDRKFKETAINLFSAMTKYRHMEIHAKKPYYTERFAMQAKGFLDMLHGPGDHTKIRIELEGRRPDSIRLQLYQGIEYLVDNMDTEGLYSLLKEATNIRMFADCVEMYVDPTKKGATIDKERTWKLELDSFLIEAQVCETFHKHTLLTEADIEYIHNAFAQFPPEQFAYRVSKGELRAVRSQ